MLNCAECGVSEIPMSKILKIVYSIYVLLFCICVAILGSNNTNYKPLISDLSKTNSVEIVKQLDAAKIDYVANPDSNILFVEVEQYNNASTLLLGLLPAQAESEIVIKLEAMADKVIPFYELGWYIILSKLTFCFIIYIITMLTIIRPLLRIEIFGKGA